MRSRKRRAPLQSNPVVDLLRAMAKAQKRGQFAEAAALALEAGESFRLSQRAMIDRAGGAGFWPRPANPALRSGKPRGALDPLDRVLKEILLSDPWRDAASVLGCLRDRAKSGDGVVREVRRGTVKAPPIPGSRRPRGAPVAEVVTWAHPKTGKLKRTAWSSIEGRRLPRLRKLVRPSK